MRITIRFFAIVKDRAGLGQTTLELPPESSVATASAALAEQFPAIRDDLGRIAFAVNRTYVKPDQVLHDGDELALIPPVSGG